MAEIPQRVADCIESEEYYLALRFEPEDFAGQDHEDESNYVHEVAGKIILSDFNDNLLDEVGTFSIFQVDADGLIAQSRSIYQAYDIQQEFWDYYEDLVDSDHDWYFKDVVLETLGLDGESLPSGLLAIRDIDIFPPYRGRCFGVTAVQCIIQRFRAGMGIVAMRPFAWQYAHGMTDALRQEHGLDVYKGSERACLMKLRAHFGRLGFRLVPETNVMAMGLIHALNNDRFDAEAQG